MTKQIKKECRCHFKSKCGHNPDETCIHCQSPQQPVESREWEEELKLYLTSAGDRRRTIAFLQNLISRQRIQERERLIERVKKIYKKHQLHAMCGVDEFLGDILSTLKEEHE